MKRKMMEVLLEWRSKPDKKALVISGSIQIGKTSIIDKFCR